MWKFVTRSIRETIELRSCRTNVYSQTSQDGSSSNTEQKECFASISTAPPGYCGSSKQSGPKEKNQNKYNCNFKWIDAISWSSFLAVGYVVCQSFCIQKKLYEVDNNNLDKWRYKFLNYPQTKTSRFLNQYALSKLPQPNQILPVNETKDDSTIKFRNTGYFNIHNLHQPLAANILPVNNDLNENNSTLEFFNNDNDNSYSERLYGPITAEKAFEKAAHEFSQTHQTIMGELELDFGSKALEEKRYEDAIEHFIMGTQLSSAGSMFNLALCYELGIGTPIDYEMAAKYYKRAVNNGHIDAMYNLGVFYAQGKGGLKRNKDIARQLFTQAAKKGQVQALKALQLEESFKKHSEVKQRSKYNLKVKVLNNSIKNTVFTKLNSYNNIFMTNLKDETVKSDKFINSFDNCVNTKNSTDIFLDLLGIHK